MEEKKEEISVENENRLKALEDEFAKTKAECRQLMLDIRAMLMESISPLRSQPQSGKGSTQNDEFKG